MKPHSAFVRPDRVVELHSPRPIRSNVACVVFPSDAKDDDSVRLRHPFEYLSILLLAMLQHERHDGFDELSHRLMKLQFAWVPSLKPVHEAFSFFALFDPHLILSDFCDGMFSLS